MMDKTGNMKTPERKGWEELQDIIRSVDTPKGQYDMQEESQLLRDNAEHLPEPHRTKVLNLTESDTDRAKSRYFALAFAAFIQGVDTLRIARSSK